MKGNINNNAFIVNLKPETMTAQEAREYAKANPPKEITAKEIEEIDSKIKSAIQNFHSETILLNSWHCGYLKKYLTDNGFNIKCGNSSPGHNDLYFDWKEKKPCHFAHSADRSNNTNRQHPFCGFMGNYSGCEHYKPKD